MAEVDKHIAEATALCLRAIKACINAGKCSEAHYRVAIIREIAALLEAHDRRVAELLAHNNAELERRRAAEREAGISGAQ
jgi:acyl-CoA reductase-like NAD-dependent aldehyde dehydrogenase